MSREDFDLGDMGDDFGSLDNEPSFSAADEAFQPSAAPTAATDRPRSNATFLIIAIILILLFLLGLGGVAYVVVTINQTNVANAGTATAISATNYAVDTAIAATATFKSYTLTPSFTPTPSNTATPTLTPSPTLTPTLDDTSLAGTSMANIAASQNAAALLTANAAATMTALASDPARQTAMALTQTAQAGTGTPVSGLPTGSTDDLTATAFASAQTATKIAFDNANASATCAISTAEARCGGAATLVGTVPPPITATLLVTASLTPTTGKTKFFTVTPSGTNLPKGGIFEDMAAGTASPSSLLLVGLAAVGLVGVIFVSRRLRMH